MPALQTHPAVNDDVPVQAQLPTFRRKLSPNELSYFLPSRANGANDMFLLGTIHAPEVLVTSHRLQIVWAIVRLRHPLMACRVQMELGRYDSAEFIYTPPSSPTEALRETGHSLHFHNNIPTPKFTSDFLNAPRKLSSNMLSRLDILRQKQLSAGVREYTLFLTLQHVINDGRGICNILDLVLELLAGSAQPGSVQPRTDAELYSVLEAEWTKRWGVSAPLANWDVLPRAMEDQLLTAPRTKLQQAADRVDNELLQRKYIGGQSFKRVDTKQSHTRLVQIGFDEVQTATILANCKTQRVTPANAMCGVVNVAWMRFAAAHPDLVDADPKLPMLLYTALSLRGSLKQGTATELSSDMELALGYHNVVLPAFAPTERPTKEVFWTRSREAQRQMRTFSTSPLFYNRTLVTCKERERRAKAWARIDDETAGLIPRAPKPAATAPVQPRNPTASIFPSTALLGLSQSGDTKHSFHIHRYPSIDFVDVLGGPRRGRGARFLLYSLTFRGRFSLHMFWDDASFPKGVAEEFLRLIGDGVKEFVLEDTRAKAMVIDRCGDEELTARL
ncbi:hypothetical protein HMN09_00184800 [Mycena chlorophos]|uniref:Condensation domain-containing protein n=1 Tax=Mycena chlorophos TaxID=658473 RepID=A0A8H6TSJ9_MYCCL|nr:hypothetical protein HMN09_00184800 [Mycena chlorophos]